MFTIVKPHFIITLPLDLNLTLTFLKNSSTNYSHLKNHKIRHVYYNNLFNSFWFIFKRLYSAINIML